MKILMVCLGNICRSPMAEGIMRDKLKRAGLAADTDSAGTSNFHSGEQADKRARECMRKNGHNIGDLRARQFSTTDFDRFDLIYAMDKENLKNVMSMARDDKDLRKVHLLLNESQDKMDKNVPDPYFGGDDGFDHVYALLNGACDAVIAKHFSS